MGYFANDTEYQIYAERWCYKCKHFPDCTILDLHYIHNYLECNNEASFLHVFIPRNKEDDNEKCAMFIEDSK